MEQLLKGVTEMTNLEDKFREKLEKEAELWVEGELQRRMMYAMDAIEQQADVSSIVCGEEGAKRHIREAGEFAEENIRHELEFEADVWVKEELKKRNRPMLEDHNLEGNWC